MSATLKEGDKMRAFWSDDYKSVYFVIADDATVTESYMVGFLATCPVFDVTSIKIARLSWAKMFICQLVDYENGHSLVLPVEDSHIELLNNFGEIRLEIWDETEQEFTINNYIDKYYDEIIL